MSTSPAVPATILSGMALDRVSEQRKDPAWVAAQLDDPRTVVIAAGRDAVVLEAGRDRILRCAVEPALIGADPADAILLGTDDGAAVFAVDLERLATATREQLVARGRLLMLREAGAVLSQAEGGLAAYIVALLGWHRGHGFCANCGTATEIEEAGYVRSCPVCSAHHFPRTDPAVIMLVTHEDRVLLGRRPGWPAGRYSTLAGFVSPGESLEEAVVREVEEESGIRCAAPRFVASQPWPFPASLMLGFHAASPGGEPRAADGELEDVRWFAREDVAGALAGDTSVLVMPPAISIARLLLELWAAGELG